MGALWTAFALFAIPAVGAFVGFDLAFRVTAWRTRQIVREEIDARNAKFGRAVPDAAVNTIRRQSRRAQ